MLKEEFLAKYGLSQNQLAKAIGISPNRITESVNNRRRITADTALRLSLYFGNSPEFWMNLQSHYDLKMARNDLKPGDIFEEGAVRGAHSNRFRAISLRSNTMAEYVAKRDRNRCPTHPGELLREDVIPATGKTRSEIAALLGISRQHLYDILNERKPVSPTVAVRLGKLFGDGAGVWARMQSAYDTWNAERELSDEIRKIPYNQNEGGVK